MLADDYAYTASLRDDNHNSVFYTVLSDDY
jgi:hypothetical protein